MQNIRVSNPMILSNVDMCFMCVLTYNEMPLQMLEVEQMGASVFWVFKIVAMESCTAQYKMLLAICVKTNFELALMKKD